MQERRTKRAPTREPWRALRGVLWALLSASLMAACATSPADSFVPDFVPLPQKVCRVEGDCDQGRRCYKRFPGVYGYCVPAEYYATHPRGCEQDTDCHGPEVCDPVPGRMLGVCIPRFRPDGESPSSNNTTGSGGEHE